MGRTIFFVFCFLAILSVNANNYLSLKTMLKKYKTAAAWVLDSENSEIFQQGNPYPKFYDLVNRIFLKQAGAHSLHFSSEEVSGVRIPYVDFTQTNNEDRLQFFFQETNLPYK